MTSTKKFVFIVIRFFGIFILISAARLPLHAKTTSIPDYEKYVNEIIKDFAYEMKNELDINCVGDGGRMPHDVESIQVIFSANRRANIDEARHLEIYVSERLLQAINSHEKLRPFLREFPFSPSRVHIRMTFDNQYNEHYSDGTVAYMLLVKGNILYCINDPIKSDLVDVLTEPYEEALKIVQRTPLNLEDLCHHQPSPYENHVDRLFKNFAQEVKKKWGLYCLTGGGKLADGIEEVSFRFVTDKRTPIDKARKLYIAITERLNEILNADPTLRPHFKQYPFPIDKTRVCIHFQKRDYSYYTDGTVAIVYPENDKILYFTEKPMIDGVQPIRPVPLAEENYRDAKQLLLDSSK